MYYKVEKGTEVFEKLDTIWVEMNRCNKEAQNLIKELDFNRFAFGQNVAAGGLCAIQHSYKPEGFKSVGRKGRQMYYPKANNKEMLAKFESLPTVSHKDFNAVIGFEVQFTATRMYQSYGCCKVNDVYLIEISDECNYEPMEGMVEIVSSGYKKLKEQA